MGRPKKIDLTEDTRLQLRLELARKDFWEFCKIVAPDFYKEGREYLKDFCYQLQTFAANPDEHVIVVNMPPRAGKSRTAQLFTAWLFGTNPQERVITASYNEQLSTSFARSVRDLIGAKKVSRDYITYSDIFPGVAIKRGMGAANMWALNGSHMSYLATSPGSSLTGFGARYICIDDIIKNAEEAYNETVLEGHWDWFRQTLLSRFDGGFKLVVIMTRWSTQDLAGRILDYYQSIGVPVRHINYKMLQDDGTMLCDEIMTREQFEMNKAAQGAEIVAANYQQEPLDAQGRLYSGFKTYGPSQKPKEFELICAYTDTADKGDDNLASIIYGVYGDDYYVLDVYYTHENMEVTEPETAKRYNKYGVQKAWIESNNGGRGFGRSVERILREKHHNARVMIDLFYQSKNKKARILGASTWVQAHVIFPEGWEFKYPEFHREIMTMTKDGKPKHDDGADALSGIYDKMGRGALFSFE